MQLPTLITAVMSSVCHWIPALNTFPGFLVIMLVLRPCKLPLPVFPLEVIILPHRCFDSTDLYSADSISLLGLSIAPSLCWSSFIPNLAPRGVRGVRFLPNARCFFTLFNRTKLRSISYQNIAVTCGVKFRLYLVHSIGFNTRSSSWSLTLC